MNEKIRKDVLELLKNKQEIPAEYEGELFPTTKKEYELKYAGKERKEVILNDTMSVPFQAVKHFGKAKKGELVNKLIFGDNLQALKHLLKLKNEGKLKNDDGTDGIRLVYIDPPFATKQDFSGNKEQKAYQDKILGANFLEFLRKRLILLREIMADDASIYLHLDEKKIHYGKILMDEVFGENKFQREIIWDITVLSGFKTLAPNWIRGHDTLVYYSKNNSRVFNKLMQPHTKEYIDMFNKVDEEGERYLVAHKKKRYLKDVIDKGKPYGDVWGDIMSFQQQPTSAENIQYPTQKPETLLNRIIRASSNEGDIVLDCFAGSGTTGAVAEKLGRRWIMCDCGKLAIYTIQKRLMNLKEEIGNKGKPLKPKPFILYNAGLYQDGKFLEKMQGDEYKDFVLELFGCQKRDHKINGLQMHGTLNNHSVMVFDKQHFLTHEFVDDLHKTVGSAVKDELFLIAPVGVVGFNEDFIPKAKVKYTVLRIPNSIIDYIRDKNFTRLDQPRSSNDINQTIDAVGFDFIYPPTVKAEYYQEKPKGKLIDKEYVIKINEFEPVQLGSKIVEFKDTKAEALAMVMIDLDYDGETFTLDKYYFGDEIAKNKFLVKFDDELGDEIMVIYLDIFGNEEKEIIKKSDFKKK